MNGRGRIATCAAVTATALAFLAAPVEGVRYEYAGGWGRPNPPEMVRYLMDLAVGPDGNLYLLHDGGDREVYVQIFTPAGESVRIFGGHERGLGGGTSQGSIAVGPDGSVYVVGFVAEAVTKFPPGRKFPQVWEWFKPYYHIFDDVAVGPDGEVYALNRGDAIERFTAEGRRLEPWTVERLPGSRGWGPIGAIAVGPAGKLYVNDKKERRITYFEPDGTLAGRITWGESVMAPAVDVAVARDGTVYVTDSYRICGFDEHGSAVAAWTADEEGENRSYDLAVGPDGTVCCRVAGAIKLFTREGVFIREIDATAPPLDCFHYPWGISASPDGVVYVADNYNDRVTYFTAEGEPLGFWGRLKIPAAEEVRDVDWCPDGTVAIITWTGSEDSPAYVGFYDAAGELAREWPVVAEGVNYRAFEFAVGPDGSVFLSTKADVALVLRFASGGTYLGGWRLTDEPVSPYSLYTRDLAVGRDGTVYVLQVRDNRLQLYSSTGEPRGEWSLEALVGERDSKAVAAGPGGDVFVAGETSVYRFDARGGLIERWGGPGTERGRFRDISAMTVAADGTVYVVDEGLERVQYFRPVASDE